MKENTNLSQYGLLNAMSPTTNFKTFTLTSGNGVLDLGEYSKAICFGSAGKIRIQGDNGYYTTPTFGSDFILPVITQYIDQDGSSSGLEIFVLF